MVATLEALPARDTFPSPAWLLAWWRSFSPAELAAITVRDQTDGLVGLFPSYLECKAGHVRLLPLGTSVSDYLDMLIDDGRSDGVAEALARQFAALPCDSCCFADLPEQVLAGRDIAERHIEDIARVLRRPGDAVILNFSYRGPIELDRRDLCLMAHRHRLRVAIEGATPFSHWDGTDITDARNGRGVADVRDLPAMEPLRSSIVLSTHSITEKTDAHQEKRAGQRQRPGRTVP